jgi:hypothetical protein
MWTARCMVRLPRNQPLALNLARKKKDSVGWGGRRKRKRTLKARVCGRERGLQPHASGRRPGGPRFKVRASSWRSDPRHWGRGSWRGVVVRVQHTTRMQLVRLACSACLHMLGGGAPSLCNRSLEHQSRLSGLKCCDVIRVVAESMVRCTDMSGLKCSS